MSEKIFWFGVCLFFGLSLASFAFSLGIIILFWFIGVFGLWCVDYQINIKTFLVGLFFVCTGVFYFHTFGFFKDMHEILPKEPGEFFVVVRGEPKITEKAQIIPVSLLPPYRGKIDLITTAVADFEYDEKLLVRGRVNEGRWPDSNRIIFPFIEKREIDGGSIRDLAIKAKHFWLNGFRHLFRADEAALLGGLIFGARGDFTASTKEAMKRSGTTHIVALSGYNISILIWALDRSLRSYLSRKLFFIFAVCFIGFFVVMVGSEASVVRAAIMGILVLLAEESGRMYNFSRAVLYAALGMALWNPSLPGSDLGYQLSFASLLGIFFLEPICGRLVGVCRKEPSFFGWRENLSATVAAQIGVLPILLGNFGGVSTTSIVANVLILWVVPIIMALGFMLVVVESIVASLSFLLYPLLSIPLSFILLVIHSMAQVPLITLPWSGWMSVFYYAIIFYGVWLYQRYNHETN